MGWYYRKSVRFGPFRVNLSKSGVGYSVGGLGFRTGVNVRGRQYRRVSIPGTGVGYRSSGGPGGCLVALVLFAGTGLLLTAFFKLKGGG